MAGELKSDLDIISNWDRIRKHFNKSFSSNFHVSIATIDEENNPSVTPIGSLFLNNNLSGFYFEKFPSKLPKHAERNSKACVLAVNSGTFFWIRSLFRGKFRQYPAIKLYGTFGVRREASNIEISRLSRRMKYTRGLKGNKYLWGNMKYVREMKFHKAEKINLGDMTGDL